MGVLCEAQQTFSVKDEIVNIFGFVGHMVFVYHGSMKATTGNTQIDDCGCVSIKLYLLK